MAIPRYVASAKKIGSYVAVAGLMLFSLSGQAQAAADKVTTYKDDKGWKLKVNGEDFFVKGFVWDYKPVGANYSYNLYGQSEEFIKNLIDRDAGNNTVSTVPFYIHFKPPKQTISQTAV